MLLSEPQPTNYDLCFTIFGFPVRVHPLHWVLGIIFGYQLGGVEEMVPNMAICAAAIFVSILVHELGHAFAMRYYGSNARISLYMLGGLAIPDGWNVAKPRSTSEQVIISFAGPAAGFLLAAAIYLVCHVAGYIDWDYRRGVIPFDINSGSVYLDNLMIIMIYINTFWGILNLLPVFPLDGGQISRALFTHFNPHQGMVQSLWLSVVSGAMFAFLMMVVFKSFFMGIMLGMMAFQSYQMINNIRNGGFGGGYGGRW